MGLLIPATWASTCFMGSLLCVKWNRGSVSARLVVSLAPRESKAASVRRNPRVGIWAHKAEESRKRSILLNIAPSRRVGCGGWDSNFFLKVWIFWNTHQEIFLLSIKNLDNSHIHSGNPLLSVNQAPGSEAPIRVRGLGMRALFLIPTWKPPQMLHSHLRGFACLSYLLCSFQRVPDDLVASNFEPLGILLSRAQSSHLSISELWRCRRDFSRWVRPPECSTGSAPSGVAVIQITSVSIWTICSRTSYFCFWSPIG